MEKRRAEPPYRIEEQSRGAGMENQAENPRVKAWN
jgi:hypothetical protein